MKKLARYALWIAEPLILLFIIWYMWFDSSIRVEWLWTLWLAVPIFRLRLYAQGRVATWNPLLDLFVALVLLMAYNFDNAPYQRSSYLIIACRPVLGIWMYAYFTDHARTHKTTAWLLIGTLGMGAVLGFIALTASAWTSKLGALQFLVDVMPVINYNTVTILGTQPFANMGLRFNPNEIAGALAWVCPVAFGLMIASRPQPTILWRLIQLGAAVTFAILLLALMLGQSRFAIGGVLLAMGLLPFVLMPNTRRRYVVLGFVAVLILLQAALLLNLIPSTTQTETAGISERDQRTFSTRFDLWDRGFQMMLDYPTTGVGMFGYRFFMREDPYTIPYYVERGTWAPHAHNEFAQVGADLGVPGFLLFIAWHVVGARMLWRGWRSGNAEARLVAVVAAGGLLAHGVYGMGDAITLFDRFTFIFWWMLGLVGAQYSLATDDESAKV